MDAEHTCPVCFGEDNLKKLNGCGHEVCTDCIGRIQQQTLYGQNQVRTFTGAKINGNRVEFVTQKFIKCPLCRDFEKPSYSDLEEQINYLTREMRARGHPMAMRVPETVEQLHANIQNNNNEIARLQAFQNQNLQPHLIGVVPIRDPAFDPPPMARQIHRAPVAILPPNPAGHHHAVMMARADENRNNRGLPPRRVWCINHNRRDADGELVCRTVHGTQRRCNGRNCAGNINRVPCCQMCVVCPNCSIVNNN